VFETARELAGRLEMAVLRPHATPDEVRETCRRAHEAGIGAVVLPGSLLEAGHSVLEDSDTRLVGVVGFPMGFQTLPVKLFEALQCLLLGADELDVVLDHVAARTGDRRALRHEVRSIMEKTPEASHKFILELSLLQEKAVRSALRVLDREGPAYVKCGTGSFGQGVTPEQVRRLRNGLRDTIRIKAAGGVRSLEQVEALVEAGADRVGTSEALGIVAEWIVRHEGRPAVQ
jgi:deoxyribose-phosphate aldolase